MVREEFYWVSNFKIINTYRNILALPFIDPRNIYGGPDFVLGAGVQE